MTSLAGRRVALIGGAGFIGHHLAIELRRQGVEVEVIDGLQVNNLVSFMADVEKHPNRALYLQFINERLRLLHEHEIPIHVQDARDYHAMSKILDATKPDTIVHLAAIAHAGEANKNPYTTFDHSLRTLENTLDYSREGVGHFVYFSSSMVYGDFEVDAVTEETPCKPIGIYGALKLSGEHLVRAYQQVFDLPFTIIRPSALYGERCVSRRVGQAFIESALRGEDLTVNGDGSDRLDFTYVADLVAGIVRVLENDRAKNETFNLTYGEGRSIADLVGVLQGHFPNLNVTYQPRDQLMPSRGTLSIDKARALLGYEPSHPIERGFDHYVNWYLRLRDENPALIKSPWVP